MSAHTPGPWDWFTDLDHDKDGPARYLKRPGAQCVRKLVGSNGQGFFWTIGTTVGLTPATDEANARLIAAAPDLLEAARDLVRFIERDWPQIHPDGDLLHGGALIAIRAAIAKAEGR